MSEQVTEFLAMGGHGAFIWPAYGIATFVLLAVLVVSIRHMREQEHLLQHLRAARRGDNSRAEKVDA
jgi:heme exporter protein D